VLADAKSAAMVSIMSAIFFITGANIQRIMGKSALFQKKLQKNLVSSEKVRTFATANQKTEVP
jgi:hypothetical protein